MQFINEAPLYKIVRITGPKHNFLGLELSDKPIMCPPIVEALNADANNDDKLTPDEVIDQVMKGVTQAMDKFGRKYFIKKIQYITSDSPPASIYSDLALEIFRRIELI